MLAWARTWRVALRFARRDARRNLARTLLVAVMVGLPVLAAVFVDVSARSAQLDAQDVAGVQLGQQAAALVTSHGGDPLVQSPDGNDIFSTNSDERTRGDHLRRLPGALPPGRHLTFLSADGYDARVGDRAVPVQVAEVDYDDPALLGWARQVSGRAPAASDEVVVNDRLAAHAGLRAGDHVVLRSGRALADGTRLPDVAVTVVGVVRARSLLGSDEVIGRPGSVLPDHGAAVGAQQAWFVVGPPVSWAQVQALNGLGAIVLSRAVLAAPPPLPPELAAPSGTGASGTVVGIVTVAAVLVLLQITLLAGPALAVGARRNQRTLAVVAAAGGPPAALRRAVLAAGVVVGLGTSLVCAALGVGLAQLARGPLEDYASRPMPRLDLHALDLLVIVLIGTGTAVAASVVPALQASRADVVAALAGRRGQAAPRAWVPVTGLVLVGTGLALALWAAYAHAAFLVAVGLALGEFGLVAMSGTLVVLASRLAPRLPLAGRLALRDAARQRGRTAPAVAAVLAVVAGCCAVGVYTAAVDAHDEATYTPQAAMGSVVVRGSDNLDLAAAEAAVRGTMPVTSVARFTELQGGGVQAEAQRDPAQRRQVVTGPLVDDGSTVAALTGHDDPAVRAALRAGKVVVFDPVYLTGDGHVRLHVFPDGDTGDGSGGTGSGVATPAASPPERVVTLPAVVVSSPLGLDSPVLPASALPALGKGFTTRDRGLVASTARMPTQEEQQRLDARIVDGFAYVERGYQSPYPIFLLVVGIASVVVALGSTLAVVGLAAAEGRADVSTLAAVGAAPWVRRRLAAAQAGVVAVLGTVLGCVSGIVSGVTLVVLSRREIAQSPGPSGTLQAGWEIVIPWDRLSVLVVGLPLLAVAAAALFTRSRLPMVRRLGQ